MGERMDGARGGGASIDGWVPLLAEQSCLDDIFLPLKNSNRIKYTSFDVSERYMVVGASSGSIFVFQRDPLKFLQVLPSKDGGVVQVCLAPDDNLIGYGTEKGLVVIVEHNLAKKGNHCPQRLQLSYDHKGSQITALRWNNQSTRLFAGDSKGRVSVINLTTSKVKLLVQVPSVIIMRLDSEVVQLDYAQEKLVASTKTRSYLCNISTEQYTQIGKKPREGEFGACFFNCNRVQTPSIYATRPRCRIWEIDYQGVVLNTHEFKNALSISSHGIFYLHCTTLPAVESDSLQTTQNMNFGIILTLGNKYLITWTENFIYVLDPVNAGLILWSESVKGTRYIRCFKNNIYIWLTSGSFKHIALISVEKFIHQLYSLQKWELCAEAVCKYENVVMSPYSRRYITVAAMKELATHLKKTDKHRLINCIDSIISQIETESGSMSSSLSGRSSADSFTKQDSGIYVVNSPSGYGSDSEELRKVTLCHSPYKSHLKSARSSSPFQSITSQPSCSSRSPTLQTKHSASTTSAQITNGIATDASSQFKPINKPHRSTVSQSFRHERKSYPQTSFSSSQVTLSSASKTVDVKVSPTKKGAKRSQNYPAGGSIPAVSSSRKSPVTTTKRQAKPLTPPSAHKTGTQERKSPSLSSGIAKKESSKTKLERTPSPKGKVPVQSKPTEQQVAEKNLVARDKLNKSSTSIGRTSTKTVSDLPAKVLTSDEVHQRNITKPQNTIKNQGLVKKQAKVEVKREEKEIGQITLAFPYSTYLQYGLLEPGFGDVTENCAIVTIPTPNINEICDTISSKLNSSKHIVLQTIESLEEKLNLSKVDNETYDLLDVNCKTAKVKPPSLLIPEEPVVSNTKYDKVPLERESFPLTMAFRKNLFSFSSSEMTSFISLSKDTFKKIQETSVEDNFLLKRKILSEWLLGLDELQDHVMLGIKKQIKNEIQDLKLNVGSLCKFIKNSSHFRNQLNAKLFSSTKNGNDSLPTNSIEHISDFIVNNMIFVEDPFDIVKEDQDVIRNLIMLCFKCKIFNAVKLNKPEDETEEKLDPISCPIPPPTFLKLNENILSHKDGETLKPQPSSPRLKKSISFSHGFVSQLTESNYKQWLENVRMLSCVNYSEASSVMDQQGAAFVRKYFHLLDLDEAHQLVLGWSNSCRYYSWLALIEGYTESKWDENLYYLVMQGKKLTEGKPSVRLNLLAILKKLMETNPSIGIDVCVHNSSFIMPVDILFLCCLTSHPASWFELYLNRMITSSSTKGNIQPIFHMRSALNHVAIDDEVILNWAAIILAKGDSMRDNLKCSCGYPRLWAHQVPWPQSPLLWQLLKKQTPWHEHLALWCYLCGFWPGFLLHCKEESWHELAMELIVQLGDVKLLSSTLEYGFLPENEEMWKQLLTTVARQQPCPELVSCLRCGLTLCKKSAVSSPSEQFVSSNTVQTSVMTRSSEAAKLVMAFDDQPESLNKPPTILWSSVTQLLLHQFSPSDAIVFLKTVEDLMPPGSLSPDILRKLILASIMRDAHHRSTLFSKLPNDDNLSRFHETPKFLGPELYHLLQAEKRNVGPDSVILPKEQISLSTSQFHHNSNCHWGIVLSLHDDCNICRLPLSLGTSTSIQGIVILKCGHAFHQGCLEKRSCCVCESADK